MGEKRRHAKCVCLPEKIAGIVMTSQPGSARIAASIKDADRKVKAPVAAGPPYPSKKTARNGPKAKIAPSTRSIFGVNRTTTK